MLKKSLDLGCGLEPRNPFDADELYGVDVFLEQNQDDKFFKKCNFLLEPIPFDDSYFDYVSAFDVLEHVPRNSLDLGAQSMRYPLIELMSEIHRILKPGGVFYAVTPAYPFALAFEDPTHVNVISDKTHRYFCGPRASEAYGFKGEFKLLEAEWVYAKYAQSAVRSRLLNFKNMHKKLVKKANHFIWRLSAVK